MSEGGGQIAGRSNNGYAQGGARRGRLVILWQDEDGHLNRPYCDSQQQREEDEAERSPHRVYQCLGLLVL